MKTFLQQLYISLILLSFSACNVSTNGSGDGKIKPKRVPSYSKLVKHCPNLNQFCEVTGGRNSVRIFINKHGEPVVRGTRFYRMGSYFRLRFAQRSFSTRGKEFKGQKAIEIIKLMTQNSKMYVEWRELSGKRDYRLIRNIIDLENSNIGAIIELFTGEQITK